MTTAWPDTTNTDVPRGQGSVWAAEWLAGRHQHVAVLLDRVPGVVKREDGSPWVDVDALVQAFDDLDAYAQAWKDYRARHPEPRIRHDTEEHEVADEARWEAWSESGPDASGAAAAILPMSPTEVLRLQLVASLGGEVRSSAREWYRLDDDGRRFLDDWFTAAKAL